MPLYSVSFYKTVSDDTGHERRSASDCRSGSEYALVSTCFSEGHYSADLERISDWSWHADEIALHECSAAEIAPVHQRRG